MTLARRGTFQRREKKIDEEDRRELINAVDIDICLVFVVNVGLSFVMLVDSWFRCVIDFWCCAVSVWRKTVALWQHKSKNRRRKRVRATIHTIIRDKKKQNTNERKSSSTKN